MKEEAFQDLIPALHCFGCGPDNDQGLRIKSYWISETEAICRYTPLPHQCSGPRQFLNGGIIATIIDCHTICTAVAEAYRRAGREVGEGEMIAYATAQLTVNYLKPVGIEAPVDLIAKVEVISEKKTRITCGLTSQGEECVTADVLAIRVPSSWGRDT
jgi:acyl-coenzyme A thioesterase PaaI-like protein